MGTVGSGVLPGVSFISTNRISIPRLSWVHDDVAILMGDVSGITVLKTDNVANRSLFTLVSDAGMYFTHLSHNIVNQWVV